MNFHYSSIALIFGFLITTNSTLAIDLTSNQREICQLLKQEKEPVAYLLDEQGNVSKGPINYGRYGYLHEENREFYFIPTQYRLVISPARLKIISPQVGNWLELKKVASVCPKSKTYLISYAKRDWSSNEKDKSWLPLSEDKNAKFPIIDDPASTGSIELTYRFDRRIVGEIYDATKK